MNSNHRYDTSDYLALDPILGDEDDFKFLLDEAHKRGMHIILDGVFNHVGQYSRYFNKDGHFKEPGAYQGHHQSIITGLISRISQMSTTHGGV